jgi:hypothetical protein
MYGFRHLVTLTICTALPNTTRHKSRTADSYCVCTSPRVQTAAAAAADHGLTLVHFTAQLKRALWDRGAFRNCLGVG